MWAQALITLSKAAAAQVLDFNISTIATNTQNPQKACMRAQALITQLKAAAAQVLDFNLAKSVHQPQGWVADTPCGTSPYIAPEVLSHQRYSQVQARLQLLLLLLLVTAGSNIACMWSDTARCGPVPICCCCC